MARSILPLVPGLIHLLFQYSLSGWMDGGREDAARETIVVRTLLENFLGANLINQHFA